MSGAVTSAPLSRCNLPVCLSWGTGGESQVKLQALVDSGAAVNLLDQTLARQLQIPILPCESPRAVQALDGRPLGSGRLEFCTRPLQMTTLEKHQESCVFFLIDSPQDPLVLGYPWLVHHQPSFNWATSTLTQWGPECKDHLSPDPQPTRSVVVADTSFVPTDLSKVPAVYHDLSAVFSKDKATSLPPHRSYDLAIDLLPGATPPRGRLYPLSIPETQAMETYIQECLENGLIRPSTSPAAAGFFFVGKKDGGLRPCIDYREMNKITVKNRYPLPLMSTAFDQLGGATIFTKLDLRNAYHLIRVRRGDEWKTAFITPSGHYEYLVMPFGLTNCPAAFQAFVNDVLREFLGRFVYVFLDDILIFSPDLDTHVQHVRQVLQKLLHNRLFIKLEKSEFHTTNTTFLGFVISPQGLLMDQSKLTAVLDWPAPNTVKQLQRFLGFANFYRRFIRNYSTVAAPLTGLLRGHPTKLRWTPEAQQAFTDLKQRFTSAPVLTHPDPQQPFIVEVDASETGVGAVLSQRNPQDQKMHPCAYFSRRLTPAESRYDVGDRELLAVKLALEEWRHWLEGAIHPFMVWTDHKNLEYIRGARRLNPRQARWALFFTRFHFTLSYRPGSKNVKPDALSRQFSPDHSPVTHDSILPEACVIAPVRWVLMEQVRDGHQLEQPPPDTPDSKTFVPSAQRPLVLEWGHNARVAGHPGRQRTMELIDRTFWWPTMKDDVNEYVSACPVCLANKVDNQRPQGLLHPLPIARRPWSHVSLDFVTGLPISNGFNTVLVVVDRFSKMSRFVPLQKLPTARQTADTIMKEIVRYYGPPEEILSDRGPQFIARFWKSFWQLMGVTIRLTSGYHPQSNGQTERVNQELEKYLRCYCSTNPTTWASHLMWAEIAHNQLTSSSTGLSPFEIVTGYPPAFLPGSTTDGPVPSANASVQRLRRLWKRARQNLQRASKQHKRQADRRRRVAVVYRPGDRVWVSTKGLPIQTESRKLSPRYVGPFRVSRRVNPVAYLLNIPRSMRCSPVFHVSLLRKAIFSPLSPVSQTPPAPRMIDGAPSYTVRRLLDVRRRGRSLEFLVDWQGYGPDERSWVAKKDILDKSLISEFYDTRPDLPGPSGAGPRGGAPVTIPPNTCPPEQRRAHMSQRVTRSAHRK